MGFWVLNVLGVILIMSVMKCEVFDLCLTDFRDCRDVECGSLLEVMIDSLLRFEGMGMEMSSVFLGCDAEPAGPEDIPSNVFVGRFDMSFEFMREYFVCPMTEGALAVLQWCEVNVSENRERVLEKCAEMVLLFGEVENSEVANGCRGS